MNGFFVPNENSAMLKDGEALNVGVYICPFIDIAALGVMILLTMAAGKIFKVYELIPPIAIMSGLMILHIIFFQVRITPKFLRIKRLRRSLVMRLNDDITILTCNPDSKMKYEPSLSWLSLTRIDKEIAAQKFATEYMKKNYFVNRRMGGESDIYDEEYKEVRVLSENKRFFQMAGMSPKTGTLKKFKVYKVYDDVYKIGEGLERK